MLRAQLTRSLPRALLSRNVATYRPLFNTQKTTQKDMKSEGNTTPTTPPQQEQHTETEEPPMNPHRAFYKNHGMPIIKVLTVTFSTYYGLMYLWEYLESQEQSSDSK